jgi:hypothetical protein
MKTNCYGQWFGPLVLNEIMLLSNEILIYRAILLIIN